MQTLFYVIMISGICDRLFIHSTAQKATRKSRPQPV